MEVFKVSVSEITDSHKDTAERKDYVVASKDAESAIALVRKRVVGKPWEWRDDDGKKRLSRVTSLSVFGVEHVASLDF
jgi:hypothetical protein